MGSRPLTAFDRLRETAERKERERRGLQPVSALSLPALDGDTPVGTPEDIPPATPPPPQPPAVYPPVYPLVETTGYPPGVPRGVASGVPHAATPRKYRDTRAQLNLKVSLEKMFQLKQWCQQTGASQREAIEEAIGLLCDSAGRPNGVDTQGRELGSAVDLIEDREILSIIQFYQTETGNEWTPADRAALQNLSGRVPLALVSAGIIKSLIGSRAPVQTFTYCAKTALQIAAMPELGDGNAYILELWRRYERNKENIRRKQRGL